MQNPINQSFSNISYLILIVNEDWTYYERIVSATIPFKYSYSSNNIILTKCLTGLLVRISKI